MGRGSTDEWDGLLFLEPRSDFDHAILGVAERGTETVLVYSKAKVIEGLQRSGMSEEEALDFYGFNTVWPQMDGWPVFLMDAIEFDPATIESN